MVGHTYSDTCTILEAAGESISLITKTAIKRKAKEILYQHQGEYWNSTLTPLEVHSTTSSSLNPNHGPSLSKQHVLSKLSKISISKLGYLLANCYFSSGPVQIAYQPPLTSYAGTIESVTNARYATLPLPCQPISWMDARKLLSKVNTHGGMTQFWTVFSQVSGKHYQQLPTCMLISPHGELLSLPLQQFRPTSAPPGQDQTWSW